MAIVTTEGIVLKTHALGDTSRIVTVYTREHGPVSYTHLTLPTKA